MIERVRDDAQTAWPTPCLRYALLNSVQCVRGYQVMLASGYIGRATRIAPMESVCVLVLRTTMCHCLRNVGFAFRAQLSRRGAKHTAHVSVANCAT